MAKKINAIEKLIDELCPEGVEFKELGKVANYIRGVTYSKKDETQSSKGWKILRSNNISLSTNTLNYDDVKVISNTVRVRDNQRLKSGDILISAASGSKAHVGKVAYISEDLNCYFGGFMAVIRTSEQLDSRFLFHLLVGNHFAKYLENNLTSTTINNLSASILNAFHIPIPPLAIQHEIVKILDTFTTLEAELELKLEAELEARKKQYEYYRDELLTFGNDVEWKVLGEVAEFKYGFTDKAKDQGNTRFIRITDIDENGKLRNNDRKFLDLTEHNKKYLLSQGDILLARTGATYGKTMLFNENYQAIYASFLIRIRFQEKNILPYYYWHFAQSQFYWEQTTKLVGGGAQPQFNANVLKAIKIPIPPLAEQERIVAILDKFDALVNDISVGLPAELNARRKQYEYYRNKLLTFKKFPSTAGAS